MLSRGIVVWFVALLLFTSVAFAASSSPEQDLARKVADLEAEVAKLRAQNDLQATLLRELISFRSDLSADAKTHRESLEQTTDRSFHMIERLINVAAIVFGLVAAAFTCVGLRTIKDVKRIVEEKASTSLKAIIDKRVYAYEQRVEALQSLADREMSHRNSRVLILGSEEDIEALNTERDEITRSGVRSVAISEYPCKDLPGKITNDEVDIIVFRFHPNEDKSDPRICQLSSFLQEKGCRIPLLVYTHGYGRVEKADKQILDQYPWSTYANNPVTLVSNLYGLAQIFSSKGD